MKKDWSRIISVVTCILLGVCLVQIADLKHQVNQLQCSISPKEYQPEVTEALNWYLSPRYECLPTAFVESGGWSFSRNEDVWVPDLNGEVNIFLENKGGKFRAEEILLIQCIDGEEISREELPMEQMSAADYYCELEKKIEVPFGCTFDLYIEVVDNYGLHHRNWLEHKIVDDAGNPVDENHDWWYGGEGRRYF